VDLNWEMEWVACLLFIDPPQFWRRYLFGESRVISMVWHGV
jgi:hypothetical protein